MAILRIFPVQYWATLILPFYFCILAFAVEAENKPWKLLTSFNDRLHVAYMSRDVVSRELIQEAGNSICGDIERCTVRFWSNPELAPTTRFNDTMSQASIDAFVGLYGRNRDLNYEASAVNCNIQIYPGCVATDLW